MTDLDTLIDRVRWLTGPNREVDALILCTLLAPPGSFVEQSKFNGAWCIYERPNMLWEECPPELRGVSLTASLDEVVSLIERELPGVHWSISKSYGPHSPMRSFGDGDFTALCGSFGDPKRAAHDAPAIALILAFLTAMKEKSND